MQTGRELTTLQVSGFVGPSFLCESLANQNQSIWCTINKTVMIQTRITNLSSTIRTVECTITQTPTFVILNASMTLHPQESKKISIVFAPAREDTYLGELVMTDAEGGETNVLQLNTICGQPLLLHPVNTNSRRILYPGDDYGSGLPLLPEKKRRIKLVDNMKQTNNSTASIHNNANNANNANANFIKNLLTDEIARMTIEDGLRAIEAWHTNICQSMKRVRTTLNEIKNDHNDSVEGNSIETSGEKYKESHDERQQRMIILQATLTRYQKEKAKVTTMSIKIKKMEEKVTSIHHKWKIMHNACTSAEISWKRAQCNLSEDCQTIVDHKRYFLARQELQHVQLEKDQVDANVCRSSHICVLQANLFSMKEQYLVLQEEMQLQRRQQQQQQKQQTMVKVEKEKDSETVNVGDIVNGDNIDNRNITERKYHRMKKEMMKEENSLNMVLTKTKTIDYMKLLSKSKDDNTVILQGDKKKEKNIQSKKVILHQGGLSQNGTKVSVVYRYLLSFLIFFTSHFSFLLFSHCSPHLSLIVLLS